MTDRDVVGRVAKMFGTRVAKRPASWLGKRPMFVTGISGPGAIAIIEQILPWLGKRRTIQATRALGHAQKDKRAWPHKLRYEGPRPRGRPPSK